MENRLNPTGEGKSQKKEWYKKWWIIIIGIIILVRFFWIAAPILLIWFAWKNLAKLNKKARIIAIANISLILMIFAIYKISSDPEYSSKDVEKKEVAKQAQEQTPELTKPIQEEVAQIEAVVAQPQSSVTQQPQPQGEPQVQTKTEIKIPKYEIAHEVSGKRYDGAKIYYVLVDPVKLSDASFKDDVKAIINNITKEKGAKISVIIYDKKSSLESSYDEASYQKIPTQKEKTEDEIHNVAIFSGELKTDIYPNTLSFFPATFTNNKTVGKYVETIEFNPSKG